MRFVARLRSYLRAFALPVAIALVVRATLVQAYHIPSGSMENTLFPGDFLLAEKWSFGPAVPGRVPGLSTVPSIHVPGIRHPEAGDLVIFESPENPGVDLVKRCVARAGQTVEVRDKRLYVDGIPSDTDRRVKHEDPNTVSRRDDFGPFVVPEDHFFAMGDNRDNSFDSRFFGAVPYENVRARPLAIYFSWNSGAALADKIRWRHLGTVR